MAIRYFPNLLMRFGDICHFKTASGDSQRRILRICALLGLVIALLMAFPKNTLMCIKKKEKKSQINNNNNGYL